ncbi:hypothetical protein Tco_0837323, partial [Tanacetum coccineum]
NGQKSDQLGCNFVFNNKACFICGDFDHIQYYCPNAYKHMVPRAVLMKTGLKTVKNAKPLSTVRSVNTARPVSTARPNVNTVRARGFNAVKPSACWVWRPIKPNGASLSNSQLNDKGFVDSGCSRHMSGNIAHLSDFKDFDGGFVTFGGGANGGRITGKGMQEGSESNISSQKDQDCIFMPIWKDASYFEDITPQSVDDVQFQGQDGPHDDSSFQDDGIDDHQVNTASPQVNTASPQVNTGSRELSTADYAVNTATSEGLMGPIPTTEDSQQEDQGIDLGNLSPSYAVSSTPHTRIHKDHPIDHVIG